MANRLCQSCGYSLEGLVAQSGFVICPECNRRSEYPAKPTATKKRPDLGFFKVPVAVGVIDMVILAVVVKPPTGALILGFGGIGNLFILVGLALLNGLVTTVWSAEILIQKNRLHRAVGEPPRSIFASVLLAMFFGVIAVVLTAACGMFVVNWASTP